MNLAVQGLGDVQELAETISQSTGMVADKAHRLADISGEINAIAEALENCDTAGANRNITELADQVGGMGSRLEEVLKILDDIRQVSSGIGQVADQTNVLSLNASIQAARSGEAGRRFAVVADEVKSLASRSKESSSGIEERVQALIDSVHSLQEETEQSIDKARRASRRVTGITEANDDSGRRLTRVGSHLQDAFERENELLRILVKTGVESEHSLFLQKTIETAALIGQTFEEAVLAGRIGMEALFSDKYHPVAGSNPEQFTTPYIDFTDEVLPPIQEPVCEWNPRIAFCAAVRSDSFLPTHILKVTNPQRLNPAKPEDIAWNDANCRNRRFFRDPTGLAAGANTEKCMVRVYDRKLGDRIVIMYDASSPIYVNGRHWGGLRLGYKAED